MPQSWPTEECPDSLAGLYCCNECVLDAFSRGYAAKAFEPEDDAES